MPETTIRPGMSVRGDRGLGSIVCLLDNTWAAVNFADEIVRVPLARLRVNATSNVSGQELVAALRTYKVLALRLEKGEHLHEDEHQLLAAAQRRLELAEPAVDAYAQRQRDIRAAQPKVPAAVAHARAARALALAAQPTQAE